MKHTPSQTPPRATTTAVETAESAAPHTFLSYRASFRLSSSGNGASCENRSNAVLQICSAFWPNCGTQLPSSIVAFKGAISVNESSTIRQKTESHKEAYAVDAADAPPRRRSATARIAATSIMCRCIIGFNRSRCSCLGFFNPGWLVAGGCWNLGHQLHRGIQLGENRSPSPQKVGRRQVEVTVRSSGVGCQTSYINTMTAVRTVAFFLATNGGFRVVNGTEW